MTREDKQTFTLRIAEANSAQLVVILYEMAVSYLRDAIRGLEEEEPSAFEEGICRGRGCIHELLTSLDCQYEIGRNLAGLYFYCLRKLVRGREGRRREELEEVIHILDRLRDAYSRIAGSKQEEPLMQHTQRVLGGILYGRDARSCVVTEGDGARGLLV